MLCMLGHFTACPTNDVDVGSIIVPFSRGRGIVQCSPSLCIVRCSFSPASGRLSTLTPRPSYRTPLPSLFLLLLVTRPPARLPRRANPLSSPLFPTLPLAQEAHHVRAYLHSMNRLCIPSTPPPLPVICAPPPFATIRYPWSLLFFFIPILLAYGAELRNPVDLVKLGSSV